MTSRPAAVSPSRRTIRPVAVAGFAIVHLAALGVFWVGFSWSGILLCLASYYLRMFAITAGFHRYFSHRTYRMNRFWQFALAFLGQTSAQRGVLWWASIHRHHHRYSDQPEDAHSPIQRGFWWSHIGWILSDEFRETEIERIPDLEPHRELRWLNRNEYLATMLYAVAMAFAFGPAGLFYGYFLSTVLLWHGTFSINSVMHLFGRRVYETSDDSRNSFLFALLTMGEGWHNNHHHYPGSAAQGFRWWELDFSYYILRAGSRLGIVRDLRAVPARVKAARVNAGARANVEIATAGISLHERVEILSRRWSELEHSAVVAAHHAIDDLNAARASAAARLDALQKEYAAARSRAGRAADRRLEELSAEIDRTREALAETLEALLTAAGGGGGWALESGG
ncbi:MAG TPA: acyl-CoA desaturase [Thermoanaerobaculia bacterium]|nr:acyl-CoA desaturase [Thermoanaerobaculia bacterium]